MYVRRIDGGLEILAPAKINLFFEVLAKRGDGFHEIETLMAPINRLDSLSFEDDPTGRLHLACRWSYDLDTPQPSPKGDDSAALDELLPSEDQNLAMRAVKLLRERAGVSRGARMRLIKRIPARAGLGGGSSDAAAALLAANRVWGLGWTLEQLAELSAELGSDVPFFFHGGAAICRGRGDQITQVSGLGRIDLVVIRPPEGLATADVYRAVRVPTKPECVEPFLHKLRAREFPRRGTPLTNRLQQPAAGLSPWIGRLEKELGTTDCVSWGMSGSGTSCFGICHHATHARRIASYLNARRVGHVFAACTL